MVPSTAKIVIIGAGVLGTSAAFQRMAGVIQERRGLPTITPDGQHLVSTVEQGQGLIVLSGCQVGGIWASPGLGQIVADIVSGQESLPTAAFKVERFADSYAHETPLRAQCEQVYVCHYWDMY